MNIVYSIGFLASLYVILRVVHQLFVMAKMVLLPNPFKMEVYGEWAVITGCTDGIGTFTATASHLTIQHSSKIKHNSKIQ